MMNELELSKMTRSLCILLFLATLCQQSYGSDQCASAGKVDSFCSFFNNRAPKPNPHLTNCTWYSESSCCRQEEIDSIFSKVKPLQGASKDCQRHINYLMCYVCAPTQNKFYKQEKLHVCEDFCNNLYDACKSAILTGSVISDLYSSGHDFCTSRSFIVMDQEGEENERQCFTKFDNVKTSAANGTKSNTVFLLCMVALTCFLCDFVTTPKAKSKKPQKMEKPLISQNLRKFRSFWSLSTSLHTRVWIFVLLNLLYLANVGHALTSDNVAMWAKILSEDLLRLSHDGMKDDSAQELYDNAQYTEELINGSLKVNEIKAKLDKFFSSKIHMTTKLAEIAGKAYEERKVPSVKSTHIQDLSEDYFIDADSFWSWSKRHPLTFSRKFNMEIAANKSVVKLSSDTLRTDPAAIETAVWSSELNRQFVENAQNDSDIRWQYFGSNIGLLRSFPAREWPRNHIGFHDDYDPRFRPWYISATSGPKNIVIVLDASSSMGEDGRFDTAKKAIKTLLQTLNKDDHVSIVVARSPYFTNSGVPMNTTSTPLTCQHGLVRATRSNVRQLLASLDSITPEGGSNYKDGIKMAYNLFKEPGAQGCHNILFYVTDNSHQDGNNVRCSRGYYKYDAENRRQYNPGDRCVYDWSKLPAYIQSVEKENGVYASSVFPVIIRSLGSISRELMCAENFLVLEIKRSSDILKPMQPYFNYLAESSGYDRVSVTAPYLDSGGLGLVFTVSAPVYSPISRKLVGVVGIDVSFAKVESLLTNEAWGSAYAFMIDSYGHALIHPASWSSSKLVGDPVYPDITELEPRTEDFQSVVEQMVQKKTGSKRIEDTQRAVQSNGFIVWQSVPFTLFQYTGIRNSDYSVGVSMADSDVLYRNPRDPSRNATPSRVLISDPEFGAFVYSTSVRDYSSVSLAPRAFCNPQRFLEKRLPTVAAMEQYLNSDAVADCPSGIFHKAVRPDVKITSALEKLWLNRPAELHTAIPWTYIGLESGVTRVYPAAPSDRSYDPTTRPWYLHAMANKGKLAISSVYLDQGGVGKVVTLSRTVHRGGDPTPHDCDNLPASNGCLCENSTDCESGVCLGNNCASSVVHGVIALDMKYKDLDSRVRNLSQRSGIDCGDNCYLLDTRGNFVLDSAFLNVSVKDQHQYEKKSLAAKRGYIFNELLKKGIFQQHRRTDYQAQCSHDEEACTHGTDAQTQKGPIRPYLTTMSCVKTVLYYTGNWDKANKMGVISGTLSGDPCGQGEYYFTTVPHTNLFLVMIDDYQQTPTQYDFNCHLSTSVHAPGSFPLLEDPCKASTTVSHGRIASVTKCPALKEIKIPTQECSLATANHKQGKSLLQYCLLYFVCIIACKSMNSGYV